MKFSRGYQFNMNWYNRQLKIAGIMRGWSQEELEKVRKLLEEGSNYSQIGRLFGVSSNAIKSLNKKYNFVHREEKRITQEIIDKVIDLRKNTNMSIVDMAREVGFGTNSINKILKNNNIVKERLSQNDILRIISLYQKGEKIKDLASIYNINESTIVRALKKSKVFDPERQFSVRRSVIKEKNRRYIPEILQKYKDGYSINELTIGYEEPASSIKNLLKEHNIHIRNITEQSQMELARNKRSEIAKNTWKEKGGLSGLLLSYPTRQQAIDYLNNFIGNKIQSEGKSNQLYVVYKDHMDIINDHVYPDEIQQPI